MANSVIHTGMLPVLTWGRGNRGVLISAMGTEEKIKTPFKLPVVKDDKTSDIHIEYEPVEMQIKECIVRLNDQVINAADYTECIIRGFCRAYMVAMADKKSGGDVVRLFLTDVPELYCGIPNSMQCILWLRFIRII